MGVYDPKTPRSINSLSSVLFLLVAALAYCGWFYLPHWLSFFPLSKLMKAACYAGYRTTDDNRLVENLVKDAKGAGAPVVKDDFVLYREPYSAEEIIAMSDGQREDARRRGKRIEVRFRKTVNAKWPLMEKWTRLTFEQAHSAELEQVKW